MNFADFINDYLIDHDLTTAQLGRLVGVSQSCVSCWARGVSLPRMPHLYRVCAVLGVSCETFRQPIVVRRPAAPVEEVRHAA